MPSKRPIPFYDQYPYPKKGRIEGKFIFPRGSFAPASYPQRFYEEDVGSYEGRLNRDEGYHNMRSFGPSQAMFNRDSLRFVPQPRFPHPKNELPSRVSVGYFERGKDELPDLVKANIGSYLGEDRPRMATFKKAVEPYLSPDALLRKNLLRESEQYELLPNYHYYDPEDYYND